MNAPNKRLDLTIEQARVDEIVNRIWMAKLTLSVVLGLFVLGFICFIVAMFALPSDAVAKGLLGGIDTLLGFQLRQINKHLYPSRENQSQQPADPSH
jgi:hypothetical protein